MGVANTTTGRRRSPLRKIGREADEAIADLREEYELALTRLASRHREEAIALVQRYTAAKRALRDEFAAKVDEVLGGDLE